MARPQHKNRNADEVQHDRRHVHHVVGPITPTGKKAVEVAENFLGPEINAAFPGIPVRQLDHRDALRQEKQNQRDDPQPDRDSAIRGNRRQYIQVAYIDDKQEYEVALTEYPLEVRGSGGRRRDVRLRSRGLVTQTVLSLINVRPRRRTGRRVPAGPSRGRGRPLQKQRGAYQFRLPCAARKSSIARPTSTASPAPRG